MKTETAAARRSRRTASCASGSSGSSAGSVPRRRASPVTDELARWAARRADDLIAPAEAEVVAELKAALLRAAEAEMRGESAAPAPARAEPKPAPQVTEASDERELLWAYCVTRA